jgi:hypothetical protein
MAFFIGLPFITTPSRVGRCIQDVRIYQEPYDVRNDDF